MLGRLLLCLAFSALAFARPNALRTTAEWWDNSIVYQIYPRSFKDSDGDGIGDLPGITSKLEHVREIADTLWLSPIYSSPLRDFGYDISNYTNISPEYGTFKDFDDLVAKTRALGLKILMDFVPNHTSDEHEWFKKSVKRIAPYGEYYTWRDARYSSNGTRLPPNNWLAFFGGSAWEWSEERGQYYYHQYVASQPDLNYRSLKVQQAMKDVIRFWLDRGVDGFRIDAIAHLFEDPYLRDEPRSKESVPANDYNYLEHIYTRDQDETYDVVQSWRVFMDEYSKINGVDKKVMFMEVGSKLHFTIKYYNIGVDPFNFGFVHHLNNESRAEDIRNRIEEWMNNMPNGKIANWIVGNHDVHRVASRFGYNNNRADQMSMLSTLLPGVAIIYNGDEIGMVNRFFTYEETVDPAGCNAGPERYQLKSRDPERTPFQWDDTTSAGFSSNPKTWLPVHDNYKNLNLARQKVEEISHYKVFQALSQLKKSEILKEGHYKVILVTSEVMAVIRRLPGQEPIVLLINFDDEAVQVNVREQLNIPKKMSVYVASVKSGIKSGEVINTAKFSIPGAASVILSSNELVSTLLNMV